MERRRRERVEALIKDADSPEEARATLAREVERLRAERDRKAAESNRQIDEMRAMVDEQLEGCDTTRDPPGAWKAIRRTIDRINEHEQFLGLVLEEDDRMIACALAAMPPEGGVVQ